MTHAGTAEADADFYFDKCFKRKPDEVIIGSGITLRRRFSQFDRIWRQSEEM